MSNRKFILNSVELGRVTLQNDPEGWDSVKKVYTRNMELLGVFRKRTAALKFVGDGLEYCIELEKLKGTEAVMNVVVMQKKDYEDAWELEFEGIGKFNPFDVEWGEDLSPSVSIEFEDSGFHNKFLTRLDMMINTGSETTIEGLNIGTFTPKELQVHQRRIQENNSLRLGVNTHISGTPTPPVDPYIDADGGHTLPVDKISGETEFIQTPIEYLITPAAGLICEFLTQPAAMTIKYRIKATGGVVSLFGDFDMKIGWYLRKFTDSADLSIFTDTTLYEDTIPGIEATEVPFSVDFNATLNITFNVGEAWTIVFTCTQLPSDLGVYRCVYEIADVDISLIQNFDEYVSNAHYRHEFMKRLTQIITDQDDCFRSTVFGRTDIGYVENGKYYNNAIFSGKQLRGFDVFPTWSLKKSLKAVRSIWNTGCGIEKFGSKFKVVVEELPYFFKGTISITLHNVTAVKRSVNEDLTFSEVRVGYEKAEYEQVNGLEEYNNKSVLATFIKSNERVLDLISPERADGYGMEFARRKNILVAGSEDTQYDQEVFVAMVNEEGGVLKTQKDENYDAVENIQSPETATNLDITPQRNLIRNGDWVQGCVAKYPTELLKFISADKDTDLSSTRTGEDSVVEQSSIENQDLLSALWLNKNYMFEAAVTNAQIRTMELEPGSLIKFSPFSRKQTNKYFYGWILEVIVGGKDKKGTFTLLAANINSDRLHIIDPEGTDYEPEIPPVPPQDTDDGGFQYAFEHGLDS